MKYFHELHLKGKRVVKRVDINSPVTEEGAITINPRLERHGESIRLLSDKGAKVIVLAHQGRKGKPDFVSLRDHALLLEMITKKKVEFLGSMELEKVTEAIGKMKDGDILLLENVRMWEGEEGKNGESKLVKVLGPLTDIFVLDALSVSHRGQASVVGLTEHAESVAGPVLRDEIEALRNIGEGELTLILGGGKAKDSITIMENWLEKEKAKKVLLGGALSVLFLHAAGKNIGGSKAYLEENGLLEFEGKAKELLSKYAEKIMVPEDVGVRINRERTDLGVDEVTEGDLLDIGPKTSERYAKEILESTRIVINGPMGVYERKGFELGTKRILEAIAESEAYSLIGGGHTITAIKELGLPEDKFSYISLSGKALIQYLSGKELPAILALRKNWEKFKTRDL
ncbi:MAG: phosphoglycerate kinase [bacterium]|nr:phosphoglycerate kinase [bacterium]